MKAYKMQRKVSFYEDDGLTKDFEMGISSTLHTFIQKTVDNTDHHSA